MGPVVLYGPLKWLVKVQSTKYNENIQHAAINYSAVASRVVEPQLVHIILRAW